MTCSRSHNSNDKLLNGQQFIFSLNIENNQLKSTSNVLISNKNHQAIQKPVLEVTIGS